MPSDSKHKATNNPDGLTPITSLYTNTPLTKNLTSAICSLSVLSGKITWHPMVSPTFTSCSSDKSKFFSVNFDIHRLHHYMLIKYLQPFCVKDLSKKKVLLYYRLVFFKISLIEFNCSFKSMNCMTLLFVWQHDPITGSHWKVKGKHEYHLKHSPWPKRTWPLWR